MYSSFTLSQRKSRNQYLMPIRGDAVMSKFLSDLWNDQSGISSVEYALLLAFVAAGIILAADQLSNAVSGQMNDAATCITTGSTGC